MERCWLRGSTGEALHAVLCAAGYNIRWLMRAIVRKRITILFARWIQRVWRADFSAAALARALSALMPAPPAPMVALG